MNVAPLTRPSCQPAESGQEGSTPKWLTHSQELGLSYYACNSIQFKMICIALFTIQSLQKSFPGNFVSTIDLYILENVYI